MPRWVIASIAAAITFPVVWVVIRLAVNALAKAQEDFPPRNGGTGNWPTIVAAAAALSAAWIVSRKR